MKKLIAYSSLALIIVVPAIALAQPINIENFIGDRLVGIVNKIIQLLIAVATLVFIYGIIKYIAAGGDPEKTKTARSYIVFSIIGLALILGIWGIATFLSCNLGFCNTQVPIPTFSF